jgi:hypothetical protein
MHERKSGAGACLWLLEVRKTWFVSYFIGNPKKQF